jgi:hypothetical protein
MKIFAMKKCFVMMVFTKCRVKPKAIGFTKIVACVWWCFQGLLPSKHHIHTLLFEEKGDTL